MITRCPWRTTLVKSRPPLPRTLDEINKDEMKLHVFVTEDIDEKKGEGHVDNPKGSPMSFVTRARLAAEDA